MAPQALPCLFHNRRHDARYLLAPPTLTANRASGSSDVAGSAASMSVVMTDPNQISAASLGKGTGDNSNAVAMADLAGQSIVNGKSPSNFYSNLVSTLGSTVSSVQIENTAQTASLTQLQTQNDSLSSVNLNDEPLP